MANDEHVALLKQGVAAWNTWRNENSDVLVFRATSLGGANVRVANLRVADLTGADLSGAGLFGANLAVANLSGARLRGAFLNEANLYGADLTGANLYLAHLVGTDLLEANLTRANLVGANLVGADLSGSNLHGADLRGARLLNAVLVNTDLTDADLTGCRVFGVSAWRLKLQRAKQLNLIITPENEPEITVDNIEVAQFIYLMLNNRKVREVIDTITSKAVLILGRFTPDRKAVLDALREELRKRHYLPILFDFEKPRTLSTDETITLLARMARFVVADISDAKSVLQELRAIVPEPSLGAGATNYPCDAGGARHVRLLSKVRVVPAGSSL
jgi:hypothetical protein